MAIDGLDDEEDILRVGVRQMFGLETSCLRIALSLDAAMIKLQICTLSFADIQLTLAAVYTYNRAFARQRRCRVYT